MIHRFRPFIVELFWAAVGIIVAFFLIKAVAWLVIDTFD